MQQVFFLFGCDREHSIDLEETIFHFAHVEARDGVVYRPLCIQQIVSGRKQVFGGLECFLVE